MNILLAENWVHVVEILTILLIFYAIYKIAAGFLAENKVSEKTVRDEKIDTDINLGEPEQSDDKKSALNDYISDFFSPK